MRTVTSYADKPLYSLTDAARFARVNPGKLRSWVFGARKGTRIAKPLIELPPERVWGEIALSFTNLIEIKMVAKCRHHGISLQQIRAAYDAARAEFGPHPFAQQDVFVSGKDIFSRVDEASDDGRSFTVLTKGGQRALAPAIGQYLMQVRWKDHRPIEWRPEEGRDAVHDVEVVRLNPTMQFGLPQARGIRTEILRDRFQANVAIELIAEDTDLQVYEVEQALRYEWKLNDAA